MVAPLSHRFFSFSWRKYQNDRWPFFLLTYSTLKDSMFPPDTRVATPLLMAAPPTCHSSLCSWTSYILSPGPGGSSFSVSLGGASTWHSISQTDRPHWLGNLSMFSSPGDNRCTGHWLMRQHGACEAAFTAFRPQSAVSQPAWHTAAALTYVGFSLWLLWASNTGCYAIIDYMEAITFESLTAFTHIQWISVNPACAWIWSTLSHFNWGLWWIKWFAEMKEIIRHVSVYRIFIT